MVNLNTFLAQTDRTQNIQLLTDKATIFLEPLSELKHSILGLNRIEMVMLPGMV